ncbi:GL21118 [Drosophila persimilis]|uniref:GL21118 n=1 Tax=Drosophila persimilis TaxID=7234 RepID=B4GXF6_DROPE|nr:GL21118 [Drosophila persimilis]
MMQHIPATVESWRSKTPQMRNYILLCPVSCVLRPVSRVPCPTGPRTPTRDRRRASAPITHRIECEKSPAATAATAATAAGFDGT